MRRISKKMTARARAMRREPTPAEYTLWKRLSRFRPAFTRQLVIDDLYVVDLANRTAKLGIEIDGSQHHEQTDYDAERTSYLQGKGWRIIRLWNSDVLSNPDGAAEYVLAHATECLGGTHPRPLPSREGRPRMPRSRKNQGGG